MYMHNANIICMSKQRSPKILCLPLREVRIMRYLQTQLKDKIFFKMVALKAQKNCNTWAELMGKITDEYDL